MNLSAPSAPATALFVHHGRTGAFIRLSLLNLVLNIITLSLWRFWGKTRVRRQLWAGTAAWGDTAEYTGTGRELFLGFLVVTIAVLMPVMIAIGAAQTAVESGQTWAAGVIVAIQVLAVFLAFAGLYRARRYQLSRTVWRGIRAGQGGEAWRYGLMALGLGVATLLSLGWAYPWAEMTLARYRLNHTLLGETRFVCAARARPLYGRYAVLWACAAMVAALALLVARPFADVLATDPADRALAATGPLLVFLAGGAVLLALPYAWYRAGFMRQLAAHTSFAEAHFALEVPTGRLIRLALGNWLIGTLSLGILRPWAALRTFRFACRHLRASGEPDWSRIHQGAALGGRTGEGLAAVFDGAGAF